MSKANQIPIWDVWTRLFHWSLTLAVALLFYSGLTGELFFDWHRLVGEFVLFLILFRLVWGLVGSSNVRLSRLFQSPVAALQHLKQLVKGKSEQEREHNAAGAWAVLALLLLLGTQAITGLFIADEDEFVEGAFYAAVDSNLSDIMYRIHHLNAELLQVLVVLHIVMVLVYALYAKRDLVRPMITGKLLWKAEKQPPLLHLQRWWVGALCLLVCLAVTGWLVGWY